MRHLPRSDHTGVTSSYPSAQAASPKLQASVIIPTYNRRESLLAVLRALARQTVPADQFEVLVIADGCTDGTAEVCRDLALEVPYALRLLEQDNAGPAEARNLGVREAQALLIVFVDDDVVPAPELLEVHLAAHTPGGEDTIVAIGPLLPPPDMRLNAWGAWEERTHCSHYDAMESGRWEPTFYQFYTGNASVARRHILDAGGFNPAFRRAEDIELGRRLQDRGCRFTFLSHARAWHYVQRTFASWAAMPVAYGRSSIEMGRAGNARDVARAVSIYNERSRAVKLFTRLCIGSVRRVALATNVLRLLAEIGWATRVSAVAYAACSVIYNMRYYQGMAAALGGADVFWQLVLISTAAKDKNGQQLLVACGRALEMGPAVPGVPMQAQTGAIV
jgi:glycosyltransferase involved in cell wall biosynthesis